MNETIRVEPVPERPQGKGNEMEITMGDRGKVTFTFWPSTSQFYPRGKFQARTRITDFSADELEFVKAAVDKTLEIHQVRLQEANTAVTSTETVVWGQLVAI